MDKQFLEAALIGFQAQRDQIDAKMNDIRMELGGESPGVLATRKKRELSPAARKRISVAQKKRWAEFNAAKTKGANG